MHIHELTKNEMDYLIVECNFTERERTLFFLRNEERTLEECAEFMNVSVSTVSRINKGMKSKIGRVLEKAEFVI